MCLLFHMSPTIAQVGSMSATSLKPLTLVPERHPDYTIPTIASSTTSTITLPTTPPDSPSQTFPTPPTTPPPTTITPFSKPIPDTIDPNYLATCASGLHYALYTLVSLSPCAIQTLLDTLAFHALFEDNPPAVVPAPTHDFSHPARRTLRDIYDYHTSLLTVIRSNPWNLHATRFLVLCHNDWESNGLLLVELDTHPEIRGIVGMSRVAVDMAGSSLVLKVDSSYTFADFKVEEYARGFKEGIEGYEGSKWERLGVEWYEEGEYGADDEASEAGSKEEKTDDEVGCESMNGTFSEYTCTDGGTTKSEQLLHGSKASCRKCRCSSDDCKSKASGTEW